MLKRKYQIKFDTDEPHDSIIEKHQNFNRLLRQYRSKRKSRRPLHEVIYRLYRYVPVLIVLILTILLLAAYVLLWR